MAAKIPCDLLEQWASGEPSCLVRPRLTLKISCSRCRWADPIGFARLSALYDGSKVWKDTQRNATVGKHPHRLQRHLRQLDRDAHLNFGHFETRPGRPTPFEATLSTEGVNIPVLSRYAAERLVGSGPYFDRAGHSQNYSDNMGIEGPTDDVTINADSVVVSSQESGGT